MIALAPHLDTALIGAGGSILVVIVGALLARQNTRQHGEAAAERERDRLAREEDKQAAIEARRQFAEQLNGRLDNMHTDIQQTRDMLVDHIGDHEAHGRGPRAA